jgi:hypothetical protein
MPDRCHGRVFAAKREFLKKNERKNETSFTSAAFPGDIFRQLTYKGEYF